MEPYTLTAAGELVPGAAGEEYAASGGQFASVVTGWDPQAEYDLIPSSGGGAISGTVTPTSPDVEGASWLDVVPGARGAYEYVIRQVSHFNLVGLETIPHLQQVLAHVGPVVNRYSDATSRRMFDASSNGVLDLRSAWDTLSRKLSDVMGQLRTVGLGVIPLTVLAGIAASVVTVGGGLYLFFEATEEQQQSVADLVHREVALGHLSPAEGEQLLASDRSSVSRVADILVTAVVVGGVLWLVTRRRGRP